MSEKKIRGGALVARALKDKGIENVFTLSGGFCNPALEGLIACLRPLALSPAARVSTIVGVPR